MAGGEAYGLALQQMRPMELKSYEIVNEQLKWLEQKKGAEVAAKRAAEVKKREATDKFFKTYALDNTEALAYGQHMQEQLFSEINNKVYPKLAAMYASGDVEQQIQAHTLANKYKQDFESMVKFNEFIGASYTDFMKAYMGDEFEPDPLLNEEGISAHERMRSMGFNYAIKEDGVYIAYQDPKDNEIKTAPISEALSTFASDYQPKALVDINANVKAVVDEVVSKFELGDKYDTSSGQIWDAVIKNGVPTAKQKVKNALIQNTTFRHPDANVLKYAKQKNGVEYNFENQEDYDFYADQLVEEVGRAYFDEEYTRQTDLLGKQKTQAQIRDISSRIADRRADNARQDRKLALAAQRGSGKPTEDELKGATTSGVSMEVNGQIVPGSSGTTLNFSSLIGGKTISIGYEDASGNIVEGNFSGIHLDSNGQWWGYDNYTGKVHKVEQQVASTIGGTLGLNDEELRDILGSGQSNNVIDFGNE